MTTKKQEDTGPKVHCRDPVNVSLLFINQGREIIPRIKLHMK